MRGKRFWQFVFVMACAFMLAACSGNTAGTDTANQSGNTGGSSSTEGGNGQSGEQGGETKRIRVMAGVHGGKNAEEMDLWEQEIERKTGIQVEWEKPATDYDQRLMAALGGGEKYDLLQVSKSQMSTFIEQEILTPITDFVKSSEVLSDPSVIPTAEWEQVVTADGEYYGVFTKLQGGTMPIVRQDWLDKLGLSVPTTLDEYYTVLKAFKEQDPDGNGADDTYGLSTAGMYDLQGLMSAAGVKYKYVVEDGKRTIPYATEAAIPGYEFLNRLYEEEILDPNFITNDTGQMRNLFLSDRVGMVTYWDAWVGMFNNMKQQEDPNTEFQARGILGPMGPNGEIVLRRGDPDLWVIPINAENPEAAMEFLEWWHTKDGIYLGSLGVEGHDYNMENGEYVLTDIGKEHNLDHGVPFWYNSNVDNPFGLLPGVEEAQELILEHATLEESLGTMFSDAEGIVEKYAFQAITGEISASEAVAKMQEELKAADLID